MITPNEHGIAVLILTGIALVLFTRDKIPLETSCLIVLIALVSGFQFFPYKINEIPLNPIEFFAGFGNVIIQLNKALKPYILINIFHLD